MANQRLSGGKSGGGSSKSGGGSDVVELTDSNFEKQVLNGNDIWLVEFCKCDFSEVSPFKSLT